MFTFNGRCGSCGLPIETTDGKCGNWNCIQPDIHYVQTGPPQGWQCPLCAVVHAPWVQKCECALAEPVTTNAEPVDGWTIGADGKATCVADFDSEFEKQLEKD